MHSNARTKDAIFFLKTSIDAFNAKGKKGGIGQNENGHRWISKRRRREMKRDLKREINDPE